MIKPGRTRISFCLPGIVAQILTCSLAMAATEVETKTANEPLAPLTGHSTFVFCAEGSPVSMNPQVASDGTTYNASSRTIYNRLLGFEAGTTKLSPMLAKSWTVSPDGREVVFKLREDVQFHSTDYFQPTRNFNAEDVIFSIERMRDPKHPFHKVGGGQYPSFQSQQLGEIIKKIEKVNDSTVKFYLSRPEAPFLANLAMDFASVLSAEYGAKLLRENKIENMDKLPVGTGPFMFIWYDKDRSISYKRHPHYFDGKSVIEHLVFSIVTDPHLRLKKIQAGECHMMPDPATEDLATIKGDLSLKLLQQPGLNIAYLAMAVEKTPFSDIRVRKAIHHALQREKYIKEVYGGHAQIAKNPIPPSMWSYNRSTQDFDYNVAKAKDYIKQAGLSAGFETELWYSDISRPYNPNTQKMAELIAADLAAIGINVKLVKLEWQEFLRRSRLGEPPMSLQGWTGDNGDPDNFLNNLLSCQAIAGGNNRARWCNKRFSFVVDRARVTTDIRLRTKFYEEAQQIFKEEIPWVSLAHSTVFKVARKNVSGYRMSPLGVIEFQKVYLK